MSGGAGTRVTAVDLDGGTVKVSVVKDDYALIVDGDCHVSHITKYEDGTHVIAIRNVGGAR